jgi:hypothetical protein
MTDISSSTLTRKFWKSFEEVMIIALGVLMWEGSKPILGGLSRDNPWWSNAATLVDFLTMIAIIYRFGFGNILLISTDIGDKAPGCGRQGVRHVINLLQIGLTAAAMIAVIAAAAEKVLTSPSFIYWLFFLVSVVNSLGEYALSRIMASGRERYWLVNKGLWIILSILGYFIFGQPSLTDIKGGYHVWLLLLTALSNISSFCVERNFFFPFFPYPENNLEDPVRYKYNIAISWLSNYFLLDAVIPFTMPSFETVPFYAFYAF